MPSGAIAAKIKLQMKLHWQTFILSEKYHF
jgi:hypothetical protein